MYENQRVTVQKKLLRIEGEKNLKDQGPKPKRKDLTVRIFAGGRIWL
jgi:hypothetical protein